MKTVIQRFERALRAVAHGDLPMATKLLRRLAHQQPNIVLFHLMLADQLHKQDLFAQAIESYREGLGRMASPRARLRLACGCEAPPESEIRLALASALRGAGRADEAEAEYRRALDREPSADAWLAYGHLVEAEGRLREARACYLRALRLDRRHADSLAALGQWHVWTSPERARRYFERALASRATHAEATTGLGFALLMLAAYDEAEPVLERAVRVDPTARPLVYLSHLAEARGDRDRALELLERALEVDPGDPHPLFSLGDHHRQWGDAEEARKAYLGALLLMPDNPDALLRLGLLCHQRLGNDREAALLIERGLERAPWHPWRAWLEEDVLPEIAQPETSDSS